MEQRNNEHFFFFFRLSSHFFTFILASNLPPQSLKAMLLILNSCPSVMHWFLFLAYIKIVLMLCSFSMSVNSYCSCSGIFFFNQKKKLVLLCRLRNGCDMLWWNASITFLFKTDQEDWRTCHYVSGLRDGFLRFVWLYQIPLTFGLAWNQN